MTGDDHKLCKVWVVGGFMLELHYVYLPCLGLLPLRHLALCFQSILCRICSREQIQPGGHTPVIKVPTLTWKGVG